MSVKLLDLFDRLSLLAIVQIVSELFEELLLLVQNVDLCQVVLIFQIESVLVKLLEALFLLRNHTVLSARFLFVDLRILEPRLRTLDAILILSPWLLLVN